MQVGHGYGHIRRPELVSEGSPNQLEGVLVTLATLPVLGRFATLRNPALRGGAPSQEQQILGENADRTAVCTGSTKYVRQIVLLPHVGLDNLAEGAIILTTDCLCIPVCINIHNPSCSPLTVPKQNTKCP